MYKLLEHSNNYSMQSGILWNYYRDQVNDSTNENNAANNRINGNKTVTGKSFEYKTKLVGTTPDDNNTLDAEVAIPLKYLSNFCRSFDLPLINCEVELDLSWSKECLISEISVVPRITGNADVNPPVQEVPSIQTTAATLQKDNAKLYVPVVTFSINDNINFSENIKQGFKRTISWNKYGSEATAQPTK